MSYMPVDLNSLKDIEKKLVLFQKVLKR